MYRRALAGIALVAAVPAAASTPREELTQVAFVARDRAEALTSIRTVEATTRSILARSPGEREAQMVQAMAISYRAKLEHSRSDALTARKMFEALVAANPRDPEALAALGGWHLSSVVSLGGFMARGALGARQATGLDATDRAVALGGNRAMFPAIAGLLRLQLDPADPRGAALIEAATHGVTTTPIDSVMQRHAQRMVAILQSRDPARIRAAASQLMPLGQFGK